ncbi:hypothetical protein ABQJ54_19035 [Rhodanobacter sp. Si-c]|uniref:Uncharacterized protein n=1 Tax=Rhodanobacter lycopersici TaxID=3162487 RepID=A0ABV3QJ22_9GAMM
MYVGKGIAWGVSAGLTGQEVNGQLEAIQINQVGRPQVATNAARMSMCNARQAPPNYSNPIIDDGVAASAYVRRFKTFRHRDEGV